MLLMLAARAGNVLVTPPANGGGSPMYWAIAQLVLCLAGAVWITRKYRPRAEAAI
jgi:hypothetical protein